MAVTKETATSLGQVCMGAGTMLATSAFGMPVPPGTTEIVTGGGLLTLGFLEERRTAFEKVQNTVIKQIEKDAPGWLEARFGDDWAAQADIKNAVTLMSELLRASKLTLQDLTECRYEGEALSSLILKRTRDQKRFTEFADNNNHQSVLVVLTSQLLEAARGNGKIRQDLDWLYQKAVFGEFQAAQDDRDTKHAELMDAIYRNSGIPVERLEALFAALEEEFPDQNIDTKLVEAIDRVRALAQQPVEVGNVAADIRALLEGAREKFAETLDVETATRAFDPFMEETESRMKESAVLAYQKAEMFAAVFRFEEAIAAFEKSARFDPDDPWPWFEIGNIRRDRGNLAGAKSAHQKGADIAEANGDVRNLAVGQANVAEIEVNEGNLGAGQIAFANVVQSFEQLVKAEPDNVELQRDLSVSYAKLGDVAVARGKLDDAQQAYENALEIRKALAERDPTNAAWQRDLSVSYDKLGDVAVARGKLDDAQQAYENSLEIAKALGERDPDNAEWQRDLSVSYNKLGDVAVAQGKLDDAQQAFEEWMKISEALCERDPSNTQWQRDLSVSYDRLGNVAVARGKLDDAQQAFENSLEIRKALAERDPSNAQWQRDLIVSNVKLAQVGDAPENRLTQALTIARNLKETGRMRPVDFPMIEALEAMLDKVRGG